MGGFNPINFIITTSGILNINNAQNQNPNANVQNQAQGLNAQGAQGNSAVQNTSSFSPINYAAGTGQSGGAQAQNTMLSGLNQVLISTVEVEQRANYVKDLLNLPRDFETLINQIQGTDPNVQSLKELSKLLQNGKIDLKALTALLADNSQGAVHKLMMTIMTVSKMGSNNVNQLKELMGLLSTASAAQESSQTVKNLILLYLPWLPLSVRSSMNLDLSIDIFDKIKGADPNAEEKAEIIKIMIETAHFGNVMATLELALNNEIDVFISAVESFPEEEVLKKFKEDNQKYSTRTNITVEKNKEPENSEHFKQNIKITTSDFVSPKLVLASHQLIKIIIEVDNNQNIINEEIEQSHPNG